MMMTPCMYCHAYILESMCMHPLVPPKLSGPAWAWILVQFETSGRNCPLKGFILWMSCKMYKVHEKERSGTENASFSTFHISIMQHQSNILNSACGRKMIIFHFKLWFPLIMAKTHGIGIREAAFLVSGSLAVSLLTFPFCLALPLIFQLMTWKDSKH